MEFCFIKNSMVVNVLVCDDAFAEMWAQKNGYDNFILRPNMRVGIGHYYNDATDKFYFDAEFVAEIPNE